MTDDHNTLARLIFLIWRGVNAERKSRYRMSIWSEFENAIRSAAYTDSIGKFVEKLCAKMNAEVGTNAQEREEGLRIISEIQPRQALKLARDETSLIVLLARDMNEQRKARKQDPGLFDTVDQVEE